MIQAYIYSVWNKTKQFYINKIVYTLHKIYLEALQSSAFRLDKIRLGIRYNIFRVAFSSYIYFLWYSTFSLMIIAQTYMTCVLHQRELVGASRQWKCARMAEYLWALLPGYPKLVWGIMMSSFDVPLRWKHVSAYFPRFTECMYKKGSLHI